MFVALTALQGAAHAQSVPDPASEFRRQQEREQAERQRLERRPDVRLPAPVATAPERLPEGESPCFRIERIELRGDATELVSARFDWLTHALAGSTHDDSPSGKCLGAQGIGVVLKRAQDALVAKGFVTTRVLAQPQDLSSGTLVLTVVPGRIHAIRFAEPRDARATAWNAVPAKPGDILNLRDIEQALENFKRVPTAEADIQIAPADGDGAPGLSDLVISYRQAFPFRLSLSADDSGTKGTGKYQGGLTLSYDNWWTLNDLFYVTLNHDMGGGDAGARGTRGGTVHYSVPLGYWLLGATASKSRYYQTVAGLNGDIVYSGRSDNAEIKLSRLMYRDASRKTTASLKAWQRKSNNFIDDTEVEVQRRVVGGWELGVGHKEFIADATLEGSLAYKRGTGSFGSIPAPEEAFGEGTSHFALVTADASLTAPFRLANQKLRYTANWRIQRNRTPLTPQDRFAIGGRYTVRGFDGEGSLSAERGWLIRNELSAALGESGQELYVGLDHGEVGGPSAEFLLGKRLTGAVIGLRGGFANLQYDLFVGAPVKKPEFFRTANVAAGFNLNINF